MKFISVKKVFAALVILLASSAFAQNVNRDVPYTKELLTFIDGYYDHAIDSREKGEDLYLNAVNSCPASFSVYQKETHLARCDYYFGQYIMETYDLTQLEHALDDTSKEFVDPVARNKQIKAEAGTYFEKSMVHADNAIKLKKDAAADAYSIYAQSLSANCTVQTIGYVLGHGLNISSYAKKALKADPKNGTACFSYYAQEVYAPGIFGNPNKGRKMMTEYLNDNSLTVEKFDTFNYICAIAYTYYRQNKFADAKSWYRRCLLIYPHNYAVTDLVKKCEAKLNK